MGWVGLTPARDPGRRPGAIAEARPEQQFGGWRNRVTWLSLDLRGFVSKFLGCESIILAGFVEDTEFVDPTPPQLTAEWQERRYQSAKSVAESAYWGVFDAHGIAWLFVEGDQTHASGPVSGPPRGGHCQGAIAAFPEAKRGRGSWVILTSHAAPEADRGAKMSVSPST